MLQIWGIQCYIQHSYGWNNYFMYVTLDKRSNISLMKYKIIILKGNTSKNDREY